MAREHEVSIPYSSGLGLELLALVMGASDCKVSIPYSSGLGLERSNVARRYILFF